MKKFWNDFKKFISKGSVMELAIAVVIGGAFGKIVTSLVNDIIMPLISLIFTAVGLQGFENWKWVILDKNGGIAATLNYGAFMQNIIDFFIIALFIFITFRAVRSASERLKGSVETMKKKNGVPEPAAEPAPKEPSTNELLIQIRDLLAAEKDSRTGDADKLPDA